MRVVVLSDIHGNLIALETVIEHLPERDSTVLAGDLCLDGPDPAEVLDLVDDLGWDVVMGNTDRDIVSPPSDLEGDQRDLIEWTRNQLGDRRLRRLASLPFSHRIRDDGQDLALVVHANPVTMDQHLYPWMSDDELRPFLADVDAGLLAFGHLHIPYVRPIEGLLLVDVASVGQPKDKDHRAAFTIVDWEEGRRAVTQVRVPYDVERAVHRMHEVDLPDAEKHIHTLLKASY